MKCYEACHRTLSAGAHADEATMERALDACEQSPALLRCLRNMTVSTVHTDTSKCNNYYTILKTVIFIYDFWWKLATVYARFGSISLRYKF
jgi:hypothetical protein